MTQQFLNDFRVLAVSVQDGAERVTKRIPTDTLSKPNLLRGWFDIDGLN
jgi:hypothetical protein